MWGRKRTSQVPADVGEARALREHATSEMRALKAQAPYIDRLVGTLVERRKQNHFGDELTITYQPRGVTR